MKKILVILLCIAQCTLSINAFAQKRVELDKISDIRTQEDGTYITGQVIGVDGGLSI